MKKQNARRQQLLQKKRTKRNASRKGVKYNPNKWMELDAKTIMATGAAPSDINNDTKLVL